MAARGFLDYLRAAGVLIRGMIINFVIVLPYLWLLAILLAYSHHWMRENPFVLTLGVLLLGLAWIALSALALPILRVARYSRSLTTGNESSLRERDLYERSFGVLLLALLVVAAFESLPWILEFVHDERQLATFSWKGSLALATGGMAVLSGASKWLALLGGVRRQVLMVLVGIVGLMMPLLAVLATVDFLLYSVPPSLFVMFSPLVAPLLGAIGLMVYFAIGLRQRAFARNEIPSVLRLIGLLVLSSAAALVGGFVALQATRRSTDSLNETLYRVVEVARQFERIGDRARMDPEVSALLDMGATANRSYEDASRVAQVADSVRFESSLMSGSGMSSDSADDRMSGIGGLVASVRQHEDSARLMRQQLRSQFPLVSVGYRISQLPNDRILPLRRELDRLARSQLLDTIKVLAGDADSAATLLLSGFADRYVKEWVKISLAEQSDSSLDNVAPFDSLQPTESVRRRFEVLRGRLERGSALDSAANDLRELDAPLIAVLVSEGALLERVRQKFKSVPGKGEEAHLRARAELAGLLTKEELLELVLPAAKRTSLYATAASRSLVLLSALPGWPQGEGDAADFAHGRQLARLARLDSAWIGREAAHRYDLLRQLAFFYRTNPTDAEDRGRSGPSRGEPTDDEIAGAARLRLAHSALDFLDADYLMRLGFPEFGGFEAYVPLGEIDDSLNRRPNVGMAAVKAVPERQAKWEQFRSRMDRALVDLVSDTLFLSPPATETDAYRARTFSQRDSIWSILPPVDWDDPDQYRYILAATALGHRAQDVAALAREILITRALATADEAPVVLVERPVIVDAFARVPPSDFGQDQLARIAVAGYWRGEPWLTDELVTKLVFGVYGRLEGLGEVKREITSYLLLPKVIFLALLAVVLILVTSMVADVNLTSVHGLYRDRLASAFLVGRDTQGDIGIEDDVDLDEICRYEARSTAPYHLINVALNLQASRDPSIRDRKSDFFIFSKRFIGGQRTGYCRSKAMEDVFPQLDIATAMAISAAAAAPNMGRGTSPLLVAFMTMINVRLGYWLPNPGRVEDARVRKERAIGRSDGRASPMVPGFTFADVFKDEKREIERRRAQAYPQGPVRPLGVRMEPTTGHGLVGIGYSGGGIRSASINLGITQALHRAGVFDHCDYMSTVSGGGYLDSALSTLMRTRERLTSEIAGKVSIERGAETVVKVTSAGEGEGREYREYRYAADADLHVRDGEQITVGRPILRTRTSRGRSEIDGTVEVAFAAGEPVVTVTSPSGGDQPVTREYRFTRFDSLHVETGDTVTAGAKLIERHDTQGARFRWRVRPSALLREALSKLDESHDWVNLSDGGHIENLGAIELLRRRCKYIIIGDGEADPRLQFGGLARLMRYASMDLGIRIEIELDPLRRRASAAEHDAGHVSAAHWAVGTITYPPLDGAGAPETGYLLYFKSSFTGDESEVIREYRHRSPDFPHESTADQAFDEDQFEAYRVLGQHIAEGALGTAREGPLGDKLSFAEFETWIARLAALSGDAGRA